MSCYSRVFIYFIPSFVVYAQSVDSLLHSNILRPSFWREEYQHNDRKIRLLLLLGPLFLTRPRALWAKQRERNKFRQQQQQLSSIRWISSRDASRTTTNCLPLQMNFNWGGIRISPLSSLEERSSGRGPIYNHQTKRAMCHTLICTLPFERTSSFFLFYLVFSRTMNR